MNPLNNHSINQSILQLTINHLNNPSINNAISLSIQSLDQFINLSTNNSINQSLNLKLDGNKSHECFLYFPDTKALIIEY